MAADTAQANKWIDRSTALTCAVLLVAICYLLVRTMFLFLDDKVAAVPPKIYGISSGTTASASQKQQLAVDPSAVPIWNLFGKEGVSQKKEETPKDVVAPKTKLQLELHGVFVATIEDNSTAIISEKRRDSKLYHVGDKLPGSATLAAVHPDRVLLNRQGRLEALYFPEKRNAAKSRRSSRSKASRNSSRRNKATNRKVNVRSSSRRSGSRGASGRVEKMIRTASSPQEVAKALQEEMGINPADALKEMGLESNNGRGYKITGAGSPIFSAIGGKPGYTLLSINGRQLGDPVADLGMAEELMSDCKAVITMEDKDGNAFTSQFPLCAN
ncbi:MAG: hypothetical protein MI867_03395 [Pseudomonadales bacterium]|nr:hypothetical protein [Pseudomonadales bacterium]